MLTLVSSGLLGVLASLLILIIGLALALTGLAIGVITGVLADLGGLSEIDFGISSGQGETEADDGADALAARRSCNSSRDGRRRRIR